MIESKTKLYAIASALARGEHLDCFRAVRDYHDYVLRLTIAELVHRYGVIVERTPKIVLGYTGSTVHCVEYHCGPEARGKLASLLGQTRCAAA